LKQERAVGAAEQSCGAGDHLEFISGRLLPRVMDQQQTDVMLVRKLLEFRPTIS
jgi:hypothetical protein